MGGGVQKPVLCLGFGSSSRLMTCNLLKDSLNYSHPPYGQKFTDCLTRAVNVWLAGSLSWRLSWVKIKFDVFMWDAATSAGNLKICHVNIGPAGHQLVRRCQQTLLRSCEIRPFWSLMESRRREAVFDAARGRSTKRRRRWNKTGERAKEKHKRRTSKRRRGRGRSLKLQRTSEQEGVKAGSPEDRWRAKERKERKAGHAISPPSRPLREEER